MRQFVIWHTQKIKIQDDRWTEFSPGTSPSSKCTAREPTHLGREGSAAVAIKVGKKIAETEHIPYLYLLLFSFSGMPLGVAE